MVIDIQCDTINLSYNTSSQLFKIEMIPSQHTQEGLCMAYVRAVAAKAGYSVQFRKEQYKVDGSFHQVQKINNSVEESGYSLDFELKSSINYSFEKDLLKFDLDASNYNQLVRRSKDPNATAQILILLCMPKNDKEWVNITKEELILRKCCYYHQFVRDKETPNTEKIRIGIPITQQLTLSTLDQLFTKIIGGERELC